MSQGLVSLMTGCCLGYPNGMDYYSPDEKFPEYRYAHIASQANPVYRAVREMLVQARLDIEHYGSSQWNPLGRYIPIGSRVFVLCNFVYHRNPYENQLAFQAKCIHGSVLRAVVDYILIAAGRQEYVLFGNAPLQSCDWNSILAETGVNRVIEFYQREGMKVEGRDLRLFVARQDLFGRITKTEERDDIENAVIIDLGSSSLLAEHNQELARFRVADYNPHQTESHHALGRHVYIINKAILESDVILSLSKLKTHEKVGITCGLKGFVGIAGHKDCLAHHRLGAPAEGGDEYPEASQLLKFVSSLHDWVYQQRPGLPGLNVMRIIDRNLRRLIARMGGVLSGAWYGNDTAWRMALDLARIAHYGDVYGDMHDTMRRIHLSIIDGIIAGEGNGPLSPQAVQSGALVFSDNVAVGDWIACRIMGFDPTRLPLISKAFRPMKYPISTSQAPEYAVYANGCRVNEKEVAAMLPRRFRAPHGWRSYLEQPV
jgi:hypothetical protein